MNDGVLCHNTVLGRVGLDDFELNFTHTTSDLEGIALPHRSVSLKEIRLEVDLEEVTAEALDGVIERQDMDAFSVLDVWERGDVAQVCKLDAQVVTRDFVHLDLPLVDRVVLRS